MPFREETISGPGYSFVASNKVHCSKTKQDPDGVRYMTDEDFDTHKAEQKAAMEESLRERQRIAQREQQRLSIRAKLLSGIMPAPQELALLFEERS